MSDRDRAIEIVRNLPENKIIYVLTYLKGLEDGIADEPNDETIAAMEETDAMIKNGGLHGFSGSTKDLFSKILAED